LSCPGRCGEQLSGAVKRRSRGTSAEVDANRYVYGMKRFAIALVAVGILAVPAAASAAPTASTASAPVLWNGFTGTETSFITETLILKTSGGRVWVNSLQVVMSCSQRVGGSVSPTAFWVYNSPVRDTISRNRFVIDLSAVSNGGRRAAIRIAGTLGSNGRGSAHIRLRRSDNVETCERDVTLQMRRGPR